MYSNIASAHVNASLYYAHIERRCKNADGTWKESTVSDAIEELRAYTDAVASLNVEVIMRCQKLTAIVMKMQLPEPDRKLMTDFGGLVSQMFSRADERYRRAAESMDPAERQLIEEATQRIADDIRAYNRQKRGAS